MRILIISLLLLSTACAGESADDGGTGTGGTSGTGGAAPGSGGTAGGAAEVGEPCADAAECPAGGSGTAACLADWPGGYCAVSSCAQHGHDCPNDPGLGGTAKTGARCVLAPIETCLALCASHADCREGYECVPKPDAAGHGSAEVCFPKLSSSGSGGMGSGGGMMDGGM